MDRYYRPDEKVDNIKFVCTGRRPVRTIETLEEGKSRKDHGKEAEKYSKDHQLDKLQNERYVAVLK